MTKDTNTPADAQSSAVSFEPLRPGAIGRYLHWAEIFIQRYYLEKIGQDLTQEDEKSRSPAGRVWQALSDLDGKVAGLEFKSGVGSEREHNPGKRRSDLGHLVVDHQIKITQATAAAIVFATIIPQYDSSLETGPSCEQIDFQKPEEMALSRENFNALAAGLKASIRSMGEAYGGLGNSGVRPNIGSGSRSPTLSNLYRTSLAKHISKTYPDASIQNKEWESSREALDNYTQAYYATNRAAQCNSGRT